MKLLIFIVFLLLPSLSNAVTLNLVCNLRFTAQYHLYGKISKEESGLSNTRVKIKTEKNYSEMKLSGSSTHTDGFVMVGDWVNEQAVKGLIPEFSQFTATDKSDEKIWHFINDTLDKNRTALRTEISLRRTDGFLVFRSAFKNPETPNIDVSASGLCEKETDKLAF